MPPLSAKVFGKIQRAAAIASACAILLGCGSSKGAGARPAATIASSRRAQEAFRPLLKRWAAGSKADRIALGPELEAFRTRFEGDGQAVLAQALLAWAALERGDLDGAGRLAAEAEDQGAGTSRDIAIVVDGAARRRRGQAARALELLSPLLGKLIDPYARSFLDEEIVTAAIAARRWDVALRTMRIWLRESTEDERPGGGAGGPPDAAVAARVGALLPSIPAKEMIAWLDRAAAMPDPADQKLRELVALEVARFVRERRDPKLAQRLLGSAGSLLGEEGNAVAALASGATAARVEAQTVGLIVSMRDGEARRRGSELAAGLAFGLGIPGSPARLVVRDDGGQLDGVHAALSDLSAEGAAILVAGNDSEEAAIVARFAEQNKLPVILLHPPPPTAGPRSDFVFTLGENSRQTRDVLVAALKEKGVAKVAVVGGSPDVDARTSNDLPWVSCGAPAPIGDWRAAGTRGLVLLEGPNCASQIIAAATNSAMSAVYALGPGAGVSRPPSGSLIVAAGAFPVDASTTNDGVRRWTQARGSAPSWWAGLGHDAGVLAWEGVRVLPGQGTEDAAEVQARRARARAALSRGSAALWTTDARGFEGAQDLPRRLTVRTVQ